MYVHAGLETVVLACSRETVHGGADSKRQRYLKEASAARSTTLVFARHYLETHVERTVVGASRTRSGEIKYAVELNTSLANASNILPPRRRPYQNPMFP